MEIKTAACRPFIVSDNTFLLSLDEEEQRYVSVKLTHRTFCGLFSLGEMMPKIFRYGEMKVATNTGLSINFAAHDCISPCAFNITVISSSKTGMSLFFSIKWHFIKRDCLLAIRRGCE